MKHAIESRDLPKVEFHKTKQQTRHFEVTKLEDLLSKIPISTSKVSEQASPTQPHRLNFHLLFLITEGEFRHQYDGKDISLSAQHTMMIHKNQVHAFKKHTSNAKGYLLFLSEEVWPELVESRIRHWGTLYEPMHTLETEDFKNCLNLVEILATEQNRTKESVRFPYLLLSALLNLVFQSWPKLHATQSEQSTQTYLNFRHFLENEFHQTRDAKHYAKRLGISYKTLNNLCKTFTQQTAKALIDDFVTLEAKRLLLTEEKPLFYIALSLGFQESTNFNKFFKRQIGYTPHQFRLLYLSKG
ncbi:helix-turn-helix transcriptional regulator [Marinomonas sp. THO17]|uniref:AraC family transcriptional regulator n=1 Tax=Marinomonas sp. THO17 TaxID=3149048 RepID=UPI00336BCDFF